MAKQADEEIPGPHDIVLLNQPIQKLLTAGHPVLGNNSLLLLSHIKLLTAKSTSNYYH